MYVPKFENGNFGFKSHFNFLPRQSSKSRQIGENFIKNVYFCIKIHIF